MLNDKKSIQIDLDDIFACIGELFYSARVKEREKQQLIQQLKLQEQDKKEKK